MLGNHRHHVLFPQFPVQGAAQIGQEGQEISTQDNPLWVLEQTRHPGADTLRNLGHIRPPLRPILAVSALLDHLGIDGSGRNLVDKIQVQLQRRVLDLILILVFIFIFVAPVEYLDTF